MSFMIIFYSLHYKCYHTRDTLHASWHKLRNINLRIDHLSKMMKIIFLCFVLFRFTSVQGYEEKDLLNKAEELKETMSIFKPYSAEFNIEALVNSTVVKLQSTRLYTDSELYDIVLDSVFLMYENILVNFKAESLAGDLSVNKIAVSHCYYKSLLHVGCFVENLMDLPQMLASEFLFFDEPKNSIFKRVLITMFKSVFWASKIKIETLFKQNLETNYPSSVFGLKSPCIMVITFIHRVGSELDKMILNMEKNRDHYTLDSFTDFIFKYLDQFDTRASEIFEDFLRMSEQWKHRLPWILATQT